MKRILIVEDHPSYRTGLKVVLSDHFPALQFSEASTAREAEAIMRTSSFDLVVADINLPDISGLDLLKRMRDQGIGVKVLVLSFHKEKAIALRAIKMGADAYLSKDMPEAELIHAVNLLMAGKKYLPDSLAVEMIDQITHPSSDPLELLSDREYQTLVLIASGKSVSEIAESLNLSTSTVNTYRSRILEKLGLKNNYEIMRLALDRGLT
ncbi:MAG: response regulator [Cyclobacteriaceae bacterium]